MASDLRKRLLECRDTDIDCDGTTATCWFGERDEGRSHKVRVSNADEALHLEATIIGASRVAALEDVGRNADLDAWSLNRTSHLIGFRVDRAGRLIAESTAPLAGLTTEELKLYLRLTAGTADRMELALTGKDAQ
jgi:hypothetical protein